MVWKGAIKVVPIYSCSEELGCGICVFSGGGWASAV